MLPLASAASAQDPEAHAERSGRFSGYVDRLGGSPQHEPAPEANQLRNQVFELLNKECAKVAAADSDDLRDEEDWLKEKLRDLRVRLTAARQQEYRSRDQPTGPRKSDQIAELEVGLALAGLVHEEVSKCIEKRRTELKSEQAEGPEKLPEDETIHATWKTSCTPTPGVQADSVGTLKLTFAKGEVRGSVRWSDSQIALDVKGRYLEDGSLEMSLVRPEALDEFHLSGKVAAGPAGVTGGGEIRYGNTYEGCNIGPDPNVCVHKISCAGTWTILR
jgi:hypothetical protein